MEIVRRDQLLTGRNTQLAGHLWIGDSPPRGVVLVVHGLGDHARRFEPLARALIAEEIAVFAFDLPGHGHSPGGRGRADSFEGLLREIDAARRTLSERLPDVAQLLLGHSMGGNLALNYLLHQTTHPTSELPLGLVLCAPMLLPPKVPPRPHIFAAWLTGHVFPWIRIKRPIDPSALTSDQAEAERMRDDPLLHSQITVYLATQLLSQGRWALDHARDLDLPTLIVFGDEDPLIDHGACEHLAIRMGNNATLIRSPGMRHDLFHDAGTADVISSITDWANAILSGGQATHRERVD